MLVRGMIATLIFASVCTCSAEEFYLKHDKTGKVYGPFDTASGSKVAIGTTKFTVLQKTKSGLEKKLGEIKIPQVQLRSAALQDAVRFLKMETRMRDPKKTGVNFIIAKSPKKISEPFDSDPFYDSDMGPTVTLNLENVSVLDVLKAITSQTGYKYKASGNIVTIYPGK